MIWHNLIKRTYLPRNIMTHDDIMSNVRLFLLRDNLWNFPMVNISVDNDLQHGFFATVLSVKHPGWFNSLHEWNQPRCFTNSTVIKKPCCRSLSTEMFYIGKFSTDCHETEQFNIISSWVISSGRYVCLMSLCQIIRFC